MCKGLVYGLTLVPTEHDIRARICHDEANACISDCVSPDSDSALSSTSSLCTSPVNAPRRRITWGDRHSDHTLLNYMHFNKDDEAWRCSRHRHGPLLTMVGQPATQPTLNAALPASTTAMMKQLLEQGVKLEATALRANTVVLFVSLILHSCILCSFLLSFIIRSIRVLNRAYEKSVYVRYTTDDWTTVNEISASYGAGGDNLSDRFVASIACPVASEARLQFAIRYEVAGCTYWDNNEGVNYVMTMDTTAEDQSVTASPRTSPTRPILRVMAE